MKLVLLLSLGMLVSGMMGCEKDSVRTRWVNLPDSGRFDVVITKALSPEEQIAAWRSEAKTKKLYWKIECKPDDITPDKPFMGEAWRHIGDDESLTAPQWFAFGATQAEVANRLATLIESPENWPTPAVKNAQKKIDAQNKHRDEMAHKQCPPPLTGKP